MGFFARLFGGKGNRVTIDEAATQCLELPLPIDRAFPITARPVYRAELYAVGLKRNLVAKHTVQGNPPARFDVAVNFDGNDKSGWTMKVVARRLGEDEADVMAAQKHHVHAAPEMPTLVVSSSQGLSKVLVTAAQRASLTGDQPVDFAVDPAFLATLAVPDLTETLNALLAASFPELVGKYTVQPNDTGNGLIVGPRSGARFPSAPPTPF